MSWTLTTSEVKSKHFFVNSAHPNLEPQQKRWIMVKVPYFPSNLFQLYLQGLRGCCYGLQRRFFLTKKIFFLPTPEMYNQEPSIFLALNATKAKEVRMW